jgi:N-acetylmuramoyl-L-alanine amidase
VSGFSVFYKDPLSKALALNIKNDVVSRLMRVDRGAKNMNFYVVRGTWTPSVLVETGFMPNPSEFQFLNTPSEQVRMAQTLTDSILSFFTK